MPRTARQVSESGLYHAILRGNNRQLIFNDDEDRTCFLDTLSHCIQIDDFAIHCYCLMDNHVHIVAEQQGDNQIGALFRRLGAKYVGHFNRRHERVGHLFQDRFWSEPIKTDNQLLNTVCYIHLNPVRAGMCSQPDQYRYSSYNTYVASYESRLGNATTMLTTELIASLMSKRQYVEWHRDRPASWFNETVTSDSPHRRSDQDALIVIQQALDISSAEALRQLVSHGDRLTRAKLVARLSKLGMNISQVSRLTGMARTTIRRIVRENPKLST